MKMADSHSGRDLEIGSILDGNGKDLAELGTAIIGGESQKVAGALAGLVASSVLGAPALGGLANAAVQHAFVVPATKRLMEQIAEYKMEQDQAVFIAKIRDEVEVLIGQALVQIVRSQNNVNETLVEKLGGMAGEFAEFRAEFQRGLDGHEAVVLGMLEVVGGVGVRISANAQSRMRIGHAKVTGGIGFVLH